jgi:MATE family multidrug resistance protein
LRGMGLTRISMLTNLGGYWAFGVPLGAVLCFAAGMGVFGLWIGLTAALIVISAVLFLVWRRKSAALLHLPS